MEIIRLEVQKIAKIYEFNHLLEFIYCRSLWIGKRGKIIDRTTWLCD